MLIIFGLFVIFLFTSDVFLHLYSLIQMPKGRVMATLCLARDKRLKLQREILKQMWDVFTPAMKMRKKKPTRKSSRTKKPLKVTQWPMTAAAPDLCCSTQRRKKNKDLSWPSPHHRTPA